MPAQPSTLGGSPGRGVHPKIPWYAGLAVAGVIAVSAGCAIATTAHPVTLTPTPAAVGPAEIPPTVSAPSAVPAVATPTGTSSGSVEGPPYAAVSRAFAAAFWAQQPTAAFSTPGLTAELGTGRTGAPAAPSGEHAGTLAVTLPEGEPTPTLATLSVDVLVESRLRCDPGNPACPATATPLVLALTLSRAGAGWLVDQVDA